MKFQPGIFFLLSSPYSSSSSAIEAVTVAVGAVCSQVSEGGYEPDPSPSIVGSPIDRLQRLYKQITIRLFPQGPLSDLCLSPVCCNPFPLLQTAASQWMGTANRWRLDRRGSGGKILPAWSIWSWDRSSDRSRRPSGMREAGRSRSIASRRVCRN